MSFLKSLYTLSIALLVVAFVGVGISAIYPAPEPPDYPPELQFMGSNAEDEHQLQALINRQSQQEEAYSEQLSGYNRVVSAIAIAAAVVLLVGSILWLRRLAVIGEGVMLGVVFTLFYGLIRAFGTDELSRFAVVAGGLILLLALVYWRFHAHDATSPLAGIVSRARGALGIQRSQVQGDTTSSSTDKEHPGPLYVTDREYAGRPFSREKEHAGRGAEDDESKGYVVLRRSTLSLPFPWLLGVMVVAFALGIVLAATVVVAGQ